MSVTTPARAPQDTLTKQREIHVACRYCDPDKGLCGTKRNVPHKPLGTKPTCVVCASFKECPSCGAPFLWWRG